MEFIFCFSYVIFILLLDRILSSSFFFFLFSFLFFCLFFFVFVFLFLFLSPLFPFFSFFLIFSFAFPFSFSFFSTKRCACWTSTCWYCRILTMCLKSRPPQQCVEGRPRNQQRTPRGYFHIFCVHLCSFCKTRRVFGSREQPNTRKNFSLFRVPTKNGRQKV